MGNSQSTVAPLDTKAVYIALSKNLKSAKSRYLDRLHKESAELVSEFKAAYERIHAPSQPHVTTRPQEPLPEVRENGKTLVVDDSVPGGFSWVATSSVLDGIVAARQLYELETEYMGATLPIHVKKVPDCDSVSHVCHCVDGNG
jgi:hypothetical protein